MSTEPFDHLDRELREAVDRWRQAGLPTPNVVAIAGSGLSVDLGAPLDAGPRHWGDLVPFEVDGIEGHGLTLELLRPIEDRVVLYSKGRLHAYQGYTPAEVVFPIRLAALLGAKVLLVTNAAGGLRLEQQAGSLMLIS
ncbi:MAG: purine-nucleoside phosphorylase, partial [Acidobacteriota bacterium]